MKSDARTVNKAMSMSYSASALQASRCSGLGAAHLTSVQLDPTINTYPSSHPLFLSSYGSWRPSPSFRLPIPFYPGQKHVYPPTPIYPTAPCSSHFRSRPPIPSESGHGPRRWCTNPEGCVQCRESAFSEDTSYFQEKR